MISLATNSTGSERVPLPRPLILRSEPSEPSSDGSVFGRTFNLMSGFFQAGLKSRAPDARDDDHRRLQAKIGELLMETELLYAKVDQLEAGSPLARRRSTR